MSSAVIGAAVGICLRIMEAVPNHNKFSWERDVEPISHRILGTGIVG